MDKTALPVAVIGVGGFGARTLEALASLDCVRVVGVSDHDPAAAQQAGRQFDVASYIDNRSLLAETQPKAVYLAVPPPAAAEIVTACAERGIHVWRELPLARSLDEGVALVRQMEQAGLKFAVGTQRRFAVGYRHASELLTEGSIGNVFLARAHYLFNWATELDWRGDVASAGGGALMDVGYHPVDLLVWQMGLPEEVYGLNTCDHRRDATGPSGQPMPLYDTDDTAAAILKYPRGRVASVVTTRRSGPLAEELSFHGHNGSLTATSETCVLHDSDGNVRDRLDGQVLPLEPFRRQAESFARAVLSASKTYECSGWENLLNLAVIEAIYLSGRTGQPESPLRLLQTRELNVSDCLRYRPLPGTAETYSAR